MASIIDEWNAKENFILACCVARNGDQNWVSVSRNMKSVTEACGGDTESRSQDFFAQKHCAQRYNELLGTALTSKRKSRSSVDSVNIETPAEQVYRKLTFANIEELNDTIQRERERFTKLKSDLMRIQNGEMDEKIFDMWNSIQSGEAVPLENLVPDEHPEIKKESAEHLKTASSRSESRSNAASPSSTTPSRPHRQPKETEKFKSYIEQRQKHNAKYHHHQPTTSSTTIASPVTPMTAIKMAQSPATTSHNAPITSTLPLTTSSSAPLSTTISSFVSTSLRPTPAQIQKMVTTKVETVAATPKNTHSQGLLIMRSDSQRTTPLPSPTTTSVRQVSDSKDTPVSSSSSFLSSLLSAPTTDIKAQVSKITEVLKEPSDKRPDVHHVTNEAYKAYRNAQPQKPAVSPCKNGAPALTKLLGVPTSSANNSPQISPVTTTSNKPFATPSKQLEPKQVVSKQQQQVSTTTTPAPSTLQPSLPPTPKQETKTKDEAVKTAITPVVKKEGKKAVDEKPKAVVKEEVKATQPTTTTTTANATDAVQKPTSKDIKEASVSIKQETNAPPVQEKKEEIKEVEPTKEDVVVVKEEKVDDDEKKKATPSSQSSDLESSSKKGEEKVKETEEESDVTKDVVDKDLIKIDDIKKEPDTSSKTAPLSIDVDEEKVDVKDPEPVHEPPPKKRAIDVAEITAAVAEVVAPSPKQLRGKKKGRQSRGGRRKTFPGTMKIDLSLEEHEKSDLDLDASGDLDTEAVFEHKSKPPLTPSICSSPASPALSTGSNCDPEQAQQQRAWRKSIMLVWKAAASHKYANVFLHPVTDEEAPGYSTIIFRPMDLSLIKKNIETGVITTTTEFQRDIMLMFQNALMYNRKEHDVYRMAQEMRDDVMEQIQSFISTQLMLQTSGDRDAKNLRTKSEAPGHTRQSSKAGLTFLSL